MERENDVGIEPSPDDDSSGDNTEGTFFNVGYPGDPEELATIPRQIAPQLTEEPIEVPELDSFRTSLHEKLKPTAETVTDARLLHSLRSYPACREIGTYLAKNPELLKGKRDLTLAYPASGRDFSILGIAEALFEDDLADSVSLRFIERRETVSHDFLEVFKAVLERYAQVRNFKIQSNSPESFTLTINNRPVKIDVVTHPDNGKLAYENELRDTDLLFLHDIDGTRVTADSLYKMISAVQASAKATGNSPLVVAEDIPPEIWEWFGNVHHRTKNFFGHRETHSVSPVQDGPYVEFGPGKVKASVVTPHKEVLDLTSSALELLVSSAFYTAISDPYEFREITDKKSRATINSRPPRSTEGQLDDFLAIINLGIYDTRQLDELASALHVFLRNSCETEPTVDETREFTREEIIRAFAEQAESLFLDFLGVNFTVHTLYAFREMPRPSGKIPEIISRARAYLHGLQNTVKDPLLLPLLSTPISAVSSLLKKPHNRGERLIFTPAIIERAKEVDRALGEKGVKRSCLDVAREGLLLRTAEEKRGQFLESVRLFKTLGR